MKNRKRAATPRHGVSAFNRDAESGGGYVYTTNSRLSTRLALRRTSDIILETGYFPGANVLDIGCGDGTFSIELWDEARPRAMTAIEPAPSAIDVARGKAGERDIHFDVADGHNLPFADDSYDVALFRSVLHHVEHPARMVAEAFRVARIVVIHEPNGNSPGLKLLERVHPYHREHDEASYTSRQIRRWVTDAGGRVVSQRFAGFVPVFAPNGIARVMKLIEPVLERVPGARAIGCAVTLVVGERRSATS